MSLIKRVWRHCSSTQYVFWHTVCQITIFSAFIWICVLCFVQVTEYTCRPNIFFSSHAPSISILNLLQHQVEILLHHDTVDSLPQKVVERTIDRACLACCRVSNIAYLEKNDTSSVLLSQGLSLTTHALVDAFLSLPCIEQCHIEFPSEKKIFISYAMRAPIAYINTQHGSDTKIKYGIDKEGNIFSLDRFYSPKILPEIIFPFDDGESIFNKEAFSHILKDGMKEVDFVKYFVARLFHNLVNKKTKAKKYRVQECTAFLIDISKKNAYSYFQQEIVIGLICSYDIFLTASPQKQKRHHTKILLRYHPNEWKEETVFNVEQYLHYAIKTQISSHQIHTCPVIILDRRFPGYCLFKQEVTNP